jgi:uncharacterized protein
MNQKFDTIKNNILSIFANEPSGHDFWHLQRVFNLSLHIAKQENANILVCGLAAWLHEFDDHKLIDLTGGLEKAEFLMQEIKIEENIREEVKEIISTLSFKGAEVPTPMKSLEGKIVQDADRLDAIGAIGIARTFSFGGYKSRLIYHPEIKPVCHTSAKDYFNSKGPTINHFYEKLLLIKDRINTVTAKEIANKRHLFMESFLKQFYEEWDLRQ